MENNNHNVVSRFKLALRHSRWAIPFIGIAAIVITIVGFPEATCQEVCHKGIFRHFTLTGLSWLLLGKTLLGYWVVKDGRSDIPMVWSAVVNATTNLNPKATALAARGMIIVLKAIKDRAIALAAERAQTKGHAQGHTEGHAEGHAEGLTQGRAEAMTEFESWLDRQVRAGKVTFDDSDPPPSAS